jgi:hypothetical protein
MQFLARWGNACGTEFKKDDFCNLHAQWEYQRAYLEDRLRKPWVVCTEVNIKKPDAVMSTAIKVYDFSTGSAIGSVSKSATISKLLSPVTSPVTSPVISPVTTAPSLVTKQTPIPIASVQKLVSSGGNSQELSQEFDNNKELKEFIKMFKKQNRKSYKSKNSNTRRNKKNDK